MFTNTVQRLIRVSGPFLRWLLLVAVLGLCVVFLASCTASPYFHEWGSARAGFAAFSDSHEPLTSMRTFGRQKCSIKTKEEQ
jgi:hypothetical protein